MSLVETFLTVAGSRLLRSANGDGYANPRDGEARDEGGELNLADHICADARCVCQSLGL